MTKKLLLREIAHSRSGEKGRDSNISVIAYDPKNYALIEETVTIDAVSKLFRPISKGRIRRYEVPNVHALNFVIEDVLEGGRTRTLAFDESGKALSSLMLSMEVTVPDDLMSQFEKNLRRANQ